MCLREHELLRSEKASKETGKQDNVFQGEHSSKSKTVPSGHPQVSGGTCLVSTSEMESSDLIP